MAWTKDIKSDNASAHEVVQLIIKTINDYYSSETVKNVLSKYTGDIKNVPQFTKWLFDFVCKNVYYIEDPKGWERIFTPERLLLERKGDCKKMTTLIAAVLRLAGYSPLMKVVSYNGKDWEHIYVVLRDGARTIILDPVNHCKYDSEVQHSKALLFTLNGNYYAMNGNRLSQMGSTFNLDGMRTGLISGADEFLEQINGIDIIPSSMGCEAQRMSGTEIEDFYDFDSISGIGKKTKEQRKEKRQAIVKKVVNAVKNAGGAVKEAGLVVSRAAFLGIVTAGPLTEKTPMKFNLAKKIADSYKKNPAIIKGIWTKLGGDFNSLAKAVQTGSSTKISGIGKATIEESTAVQVGGIGVVSAAAVVTAISAAAPILMAIMKGLKDTGVLDAAQTEGAEKTIETAEDTYTDAGTPKLPVLMKPIKTVALQNELVKTGHNLEKPNTTDASATTTTTEGNFLGKLNDKNTIVKAFIMGGLIGCVNTPLAHIGSIIFITTGIAVLSLRCFKIIKNYTKLKHI